MTSKKKKPLPRSTRSADSKPSAESVIKLIDHLDAHQLADLAFTLARASDIGAGDVTIKQHANHFEVINDVTKAETNGSRGPIQKLATMIVDIACDDSKTRAGQLRQECAAWESLCRKMLPRPRNLQRDWFIVFHRRERKWTFPKIAAEVKKEFGTAVTVEAVERVFERAEKSRRFEGMVIPTLNGDVLATPLTERTQRFIV